MKRGKRQILLALTALLLTVFGALACAAEASQKGGAPPNVIRVGYYDYGGYLDCDVNGDYSGYGYEYLEEIANYTGWDYQFVHGTWQELLRKLADGEIDLLGPAEFTKERSLLFDYSKYDCGTEYTALFVRRDNDQVFYDDLESFQGLRVSMVRGTYQNGPFEQFARRNDIAFTKCYYDTLEEADEALRTGEVDARLSGNLRHSQNEKVVLKILPEPFYFITTKGNTAVMNALDRAMEEIQTWDVNYNTRLYDKYYGADLSDQLAFTRAEARYIKEHGPLRVAYNVNWPPLLYQGNGEACGVLYGLLENAAEKSGLSFTYVPAESLAEMESLVRERQADLLCYYPRERIQAARENGLALTKTYITVPVSMIWREGMTAGDLHRAAIPKSQTDLARVARGAYPDITVQFYSDVDECLRAVWQGKADAAFENTYLLDQLLKKYDKLEAMPVAAIPYPLSIGISEREDPALLTAMNKVISQFTAAEINASILEYTVQALDRRNMANFLRRYFPLAAIIIGAGLFLLVYKSKKALERYAFIDPLTGCMNQTKFVIEADKHIRDKCDGRYVIMCFDIDRFKVINDLYGYRVGNALLRDIGKTLKAHVGGDELFCRSSGDNYVLLLNNQPTLEQKAGFLLERICDAAQEVDADLHFSVSGGLYVLNEPVDGIHIAIDRANLARQSVKEDHQTRLTFYTAEMRRQFLREQELENRLESALAHREFEVYYQPKFTVSDGRVVGAEALVRWPTADGMIYPDEFIPVFESNGSIIKLDLYVFRVVCQHLRRWMDAGYSPYPISVNLSRVHLYQQDFYKEYFSIMRRYEIPFYYLELELTESTMFENQQQLVQVMERLKNQGLLISMDDFGSGYSSLNLLKDLPIDTLKIDRAFFNESADNTRGQKIIRSIVDMARQLDILVVSEGVETEEQVAFLRKINCQVAQGFYFSKPIPMEAYERLAFEKKPAETI